MQQKDLQAEDTALDGSACGVPARVSTAATSPSVPPLQPRWSDDSDGRAGSTEGDTHLLESAPPQPIAADETLLKDLRRAIYGHELVLFYQPKIDLASRRCIGVEALVRWRHPERGLVFPDEFIPSVERAGLIGELTDWVVREAVRQCRAWHDVGLYLSIALNISPESLQDDALLATFRSALAQHAVSPFSVEVEITETGVMADPQTAVAVLSEFDLLGIHAAVDDFGTGFSSLVYLRDLPVRTLKIDKSFVMGVAENDKNRAIIRSTIALAHTLGLHVVAEGVEDAASAITLEEEGCDIGQGYFWSRPLPPDSLLEWLAHADGAQLAPH